MLIWDDEKLKDTFNWLVSDDFLPFVSEDNLNLTYYLKATKIVKKFNYQQKGYLEVTFQPFSSFAYMEFKKPLTIQDERNVYFYNYSNVEHDYAPIIELKNLGDESTILSMLNTNRKDEAFEITGLKKDQTVIVDMLTGVVQDILTKENLMSKCNLKFLKMSEGGCNIKFNGMCQVVFKAQFPIMV